MRLNPGVWREQRLIEPFDVDPLGRLRPQTLLAFLLNSAWNHAAGTAYGHDELATRNLMWVLIKVQILVKRLPLWGETITVETWGKRAIRLYALRDFTVTSGKGEKLVSATSSWTVLNKTSGRPQKFDERLSQLPWEPGRDEIETSLEKVPQLKAGKELARFRVRFSDIDVNRHVNSAKYLQWMVDAHSYQDLEASEVTSIELSFLSEAGPDDDVVVFSEERKGHELCSVRLAADGKELCRGRFAWRPRA